MRLTPNQRTWIEGQQTKMREASNRADRAQARYEQAERLLLERAEANGWSEYQTNAAALLDADLTQAAGSGRYWGEQVQRRSALLVGYITAIRALDEADDIPPQPNES